MNRPPLMGITLSFQNPIKSTSQRYGIISSIPLACFVPRSIFKILLNQFAGQFHYPRKSGFRLISDTFSHFYAALQKIYNGGCMTNNRTPLSIIKHRQKMLKLLQIIICQLRQLLTPHERKHFQERVITMLYQEFSGD